MAYEFFRVNYDQLQIVATEFQRQSECIREMIGALKGGKRKLDATWRGETYIKFNQEMEEEFKRLLRLQNALEEASKRVKQIDDLMHRDEQAAQKAFPNL